MGDDAATVERLRAENRQLRAERDAGRAELAAVRDENRTLREQQTVTAEVLRVIASAPTDLQRVLDTITESAARLCEASSASLLQFRERDRSLVSRATFGPTLQVAERRNMDFQTALGVAPTMASAPGHAYLEGRTIHVSDMAEAVQSQYPDSREWQALLGLRTAVYAPLLHHGKRTGVLVMHRFEVRPFTEQQVAFLETFADQAVIAIENARLFEELERRNRDLNEALEQQTATAEVLRVIAASPTDLEPVLDAVVQSAMRLSDSAIAMLALRAFDRQRIAAIAGANPGAQGAAQVGDVIALTRQRPGGRAILDGRMIHIQDASDPALVDEYPELTYREASTRLHVPLLRENDAVGSITVARERAQPYTAREIALIETFADQAVIAIENARLFEELQQRNRELSETLEQQTATAEVLRVIASAPTDVRSVLDTVAESAARLCGATDAVIHRVEGDAQRIVTVHGATFQPMIGVETPITRGHVAGRVVLDRRTIHIADIAAESGAEFPVSKAMGRRFGYRSFVCAPMLRQDVAIGSIVACRTEVRPFTEQQIALLETFADQAAIAIENARLFQELQTRVDELQALGEVGQAVSSSLDLTEVLTTIVANATRLAGADGGIIYEYEEAEGVFEVRAADQMVDDLAATLRAARFRIGEGAVGRAAATRTPVQVEEVADSDVVTPEVRARLLAQGMHSVLAVPLLHEDRVLGGLVMSRRAPGAFPPEVVALLQTFATQSALAIDNARLYRALEEASRHKSAFLANMSHELRTPLNAVIGYSEMLQEELEDLGQADLVPDVERINAAGRHLLGLINDILDLSKIEAGKMELFLESVEIASLVSDVATTVGSLVEKKANVLAVDAASDVGEMHADATKLRQILFNLLGNAAKFTDHGTISLSVTRETGAAGDWLTFVVADTGIGMTEEQLGRLFQAFAQADASTSRRFGGTGLGLALVHTFCEMLGGSVTVTSAPGAGSTFTVRLPADASAARPGSPNTDDPSTAASAAMVGSGPVVLAIDDDAASRDLLHRHLAAEGVVVVAAASGEEGLRLARELRPAVVTLDVLMPGLDGWAVLAALKGDPATADLPVIMLTMLDDRDLGYSLGAADYLVKPIDRERLLAAVRKHARRAGVRRALVVEDDPATREMLRRTLEREGWSVDEAADGRVGLERVAASPPDLVLLDLLMPGLDGFGFVERLRAEPAWHAIPVLVVTAQDLTAEERRKLNGRVEQVLRKGAYSRDELLAQVRAAVRSSVEATD
jgi:signal transduction histidine kinase/DNA-binding response OmpR family regulator